MATYPLLAMPAPSVALVGVLLVVVVEPLAHVLDGQHSQQAGSDGLSSHGRAGLLEYPDASIT